FDCSRALYNVALSLLVLRFPPQPISPPFPYTTLFRSVDTMARFGGDEFMLLLEEVDNQQTVLQIADRIQECLQDPFELSGREIRSEEHTSELQSRENLVCRLLLEKKNVCHIVVYDCLI